MKAADPIDPLVLLANLQRITEAIQSTPTTCGRGELHFTYTNFRGEKSTRRAVPIRLCHEQTDWHSKQWIMEAQDGDKGVVRSFAVSEMEF